jgi:hypothetical protein
MQGSVISVRTENSNSKLNIRITKTIIINLKSGADFAFALEMRHCRNNGPGFFKVGAHGRAPLQGSMNNSE